SDGNFNTSLVAWRTNPGQLVGSPLFAPGGFSLADAALDDAGELYLCDNDMNAPGVFVFSAATGALLAGPLATTLPPVEVAFGASLDPASTPLSRPVRESG